MYQFGQFAWTHMILLVILLQSSFFVANIMEGLIWFVLPSTHVIFNDIMVRRGSGAHSRHAMRRSAAAASGADACVARCQAYIFGFFFGRTPLIKLSPKKTWEGTTRRRIRGAIRPLLCAQC